MNTNQVKCGTIYYCESVGGGPVQFVKPTRRPRPDTPNHLQSQIIGRGLMLVPASAMSRPATDGEIATLTARA
jgi:hypothetical protein